MLWVVKPETDLFKFITSLSGGEVLSNQEMKKRYPGLEAIPENFEGYFVHKAGIVKAKEALLATKKLSLEQGADLRFNSTVKNVDVKQGMVELANGEKYYGKHVVICCGAITD